jgi:VCBS repeat-containing protein
MAIINGNNSNNTLNGTSVADTIDGMGGSDTINGLGGNDILRGGSGIDTVNGGVGNDTITGGSGDDALNGGDGDDRFVYATFDGLDTFAGGTGTDRIVLAAAGTTLALRSGFGAANSIEAIDGIGNSTIRGASSADTYNFSATTLTGIASIDVGAGNDNVTGSSGADRIRGGLGDDTIAGGGGADVLEGDDGVDTLTGGAGADRLIGGTGNDFFAISTLSGGADRIADFGNGADTLRLSVLPASGVTASNLASFVRAQRVDGNVVVRVDTNGATGGSAFVDAAVLEGFAGTTVRVQIGSQFFNVPVPANRNPTLDDDSISVNEDATTGNLLATLLAGDTDPDGDVLRVTEVTNGTKGTVVFNEGTAAIGDETITYTAVAAVLDELAPGETATDTFTYTVSDGNGGVDQATVTVTIAGVNDAPTGIQISTNQVVENVPEATVGTLSATDPDSTGVSFSILPGLDGALFQLRAFGELRVGATPLDFEAAATRSVVVRATDSLGAFIDRTFTIGVVNRDEVTLTTGADIISASAANTQFLATAATLNSGDNLDAGAGYDSLVLTAQPGGTSFDLNALAGYSGFEETVIINGGSLWLRNGTTTSVFATGELEVHLNGTGQASSIRLGDGNNLVSVGADTAWNPNITIDWGDGSDNELAFVGNGTYDLRWMTLEGNVFEFITVSAPGVVLLIDNFSLAGAVYGTPGAKLVTAESTLNLSDTMLDDMTVESTNGTGTRFIVSDNHFNAFQIFGGPGNDTIDTSASIFGFTFTAAERDTIFNEKSIEQIHDSSGFYGDDTANSIAGTPDSDSIFGGAGNDTLAGDAGSDTLTGDSGDDLFLFTNGSGVDAITDFVAGGTDDEIDVRDFGFANFAAVAAAATQVGNDTRIQLDADDVVTLIGVQKAALTADDFVLS